MTRLHQNFAKILMISVRRMNCSLFLGRTKQIIIYDMVKHELRVASYQFRFESLKHKLDFKSASCEFKSTSLSRPTAQKMKFSNKDFFSKCEFGHIYWRNPYWKTSFFVQCPFSFWW